jgi:hypothetical protein
VLYIGVCLTGIASADTISIADAIKLNDTKTLREITINNAKYQFKEYEPTINIFGKNDITKITASFVQSPLLFDLAINKILLESNRSVHDRFADFLNASNDPEAKWKTLQEYYKGKGVIISKDNFDTILLNYHKKWNIQFDYLGEVRSDNYAAIIVRKSTEETDMGNRIAPIIFPMCYLYKNNRWYTYSPKDYSTDGQTRNFFLTISEECQPYQISNTKSVFYKLYLTSQSIADQRDMGNDNKEVNILANPWHEWETHIGDIKVEGKFISYEGKHVTIEQKDGSRIKMEHAPLRRSDKDYIEKLLNKDNKNK